MDLTGINKERHQKRRSPADIGTMVYGKIPPQAKEIEEAVLGAILLERDAFDKAREFVNAESFYVDAHQRIFKAMTSLAGKSQPIDILTLAEELKTNEDLDLAGGPYYLTTLTKAVVSSAHIESHCKIILQKYVAREIIRVSGEMISQAYEDMTDPFDLLDQAEQLFGTIGQVMSIGDMLPADAVLINTIRQIEEWRQNYEKTGSSVTGIPSGFSDLDKATRGWQNGDLIILAARPSVGKTAFALNLVRNAAQWMQDNSIDGSAAVWSLEMKSMMLMLRMLAAESKHILYHIQTGRLTDDDMRGIYQRGVQKLAKMNIFFDDNPALTLPKLRSKARKMKRKNKLKIIFVDYLQLMTPDARKGTNREQEISQISRGLKMLAQELEVPVIALSQMSREIEKRAQRVPQLSDLRESGSLEQDADVVMFLWGPTDEDIAADAGLMNKRWIRIAKQRNGMLVKVDLDFKDEIQFFSQASSLSAPELGKGSWKQVTETEKDEDPF